MPEKNLHDGLPEVLSLDNIADGAVYEMAAEAFKKLAANIADPNTTAEQPRSIVITIKAKPYKDRNGAELAIKVDTKLAGMRSIDSTMYIAQKGGEHLAFGRNTKQVNMPFDLQPDPDSQPKYN